MKTLNVLLVVLALVPSLRALDVQTLDGKSYRSCTVSLVEPDALCLIFPGGGARVKFVNLPEALRVAYGYDPVKAAAFEQAQAARRQREDARWQLARIYADAQRKVAASNATARAREAMAYAGPNQGQGGYGRNNGTGGEYTGVNLAAAGNSYAGQGGGGYGGGGNGGRNQGGGFGGATGATYIGVRLVP